VVFLKKIAAAAVLLLSGIFTAAYAETNVNGTLEKSETWSVKNSPYIISDNVTIGKKTIINVQPGTVIKFKKEGKITVQGVFNCKGLPENPVRLLPFDGETFYEGLVYEGKYKSIMEFTVFIRGTIKVEGGSLIFSNNYILNATGITLFHFAKAVIKDSYFFNNTYGVYAEGQKMSFTITGNTFSKNRFAVYLQRFDDTKMLIEKNNFSSSSVNVTNYSVLNAECKNNFWDYTEDNKIQKFLYDKRNNPKVGEINFKPFAQQKFAAWMPPSQFQALVKYYLSLKRPDEEMPKVTIGAGASGFMPLSPDYLKEETKFGLGLNAEFQLSINGVFRIGVAGRTMSLENEKEFYKYKLDMTDLLVNVYWYMGYRKDLFLMPYLRLGNGVALVSTMYLFDTGDSFKDNDIDYTVEAAAGVEYIFLKMFSIRADAGYNYTLTPNGKNISYPFLNITGGVVFDVPLFLSE
jgi:hypothetical protein